MTPKSCYLSVGDISMCFILLHLRRFSASATSLPDKMVRVLNVAEKNDAAKSLANVLSQGRSRKVCFFLT